MPHRFRRQLNGLRRASLTGILITLPVSAAFPQSAPGQRPVAQTAPAPYVTVAPPPDYVIGADDVLSIVFWKESDISGRVRVRPDGKISLPLLGEVEAAGLTPDTLRQQLETVARPFFADISATVMVNEVNSRRVFVTGAVGRPGAFPLNGRMTVLQALALAGGFTESADKEHVEVLGMDDARPGRLRFNYKTVLDGKAPDVALKPGDTVVVR
jgi:polysaccharide export outer membrane protein